MLKQWALTVAIEATNRVERPATCCRSDVSYTSVAAALLVIADDRPQQSDGYHCFGHWHRPTELLPHGILLSIRIQHPATLLSVLLHPACCLQQLLHTLRQSVAACSLVTGASGVSGCCR